MTRTLFSVALLTFAIAVLLAGPAAGVAYAQDISTLCALPHSGVANHWSGDGDANDDMGASPGQVAGATFASGFIRQAFTFSGDAAFVDFGVEAGNFTGAHYTVHFWIRVPSLPAANLDVLSKRETCSLGEANYLDIRFTPQGQLWAEVARWGNSGEWYAYSRPITDSDFHHFALVRNGANLLVYVDGELQDEKTTPTPPLSNSAHLLAGVGPCLGIETTAFRGQLDEIEIVNRNMTGREIELIFQAARAGSCSMRANAMLMGAPSLPDANVAVAILGSAPFSVSAIDLTRPIVLSDPNTSTVPGSTPNCQPQDVNNDGYLDLVCQLNRPAVSNIKQAYVRGFLVNGEGFYASVSH